MKISDEIKRMSTEQLLKLNKKVEKQLKNNKCSREDFMRAQIIISDLIDKNEIDKGEFD